MFLSWTWTARQADIEAEMMKEEWAGHCSTTIREQTACESESDMQSEMVTEWEHVNDREEKTQMSNKTWVTSFNSRALCAYVWILIAVMNVIYVS